MLRTDRGASYTNEVVDALNRHFGVDQAFGAAYRPEAQGYIEAAHKRVNNVVKAYTRRDGWSKWIKVAQWAMRCTPRPDRGGYTPYERVTGMRPQGPLDRLWSKSDASEPS